LSGGKPDKIETSDDRFDMILDEFAEKNGLDKGKRPKTAVDALDMKESMWTAGRQTGAF
jgi:hypothetical protein